MTKVCSKCKIEKDESEFSIDRSRKNGLSCWCKKCQQKYRRTKKGLITNIYNHQKQKSKKREHQPPTYTKKELIEWLYSQPKFHKLYDNWKRLDFQKDYVPSVDRKNDYLGYSISNIQIMTWKENNIKAHNDRSKTVIQYNLDGSYINEYKSAPQAARKINGYHKNIQSCCKGRIKSADGFIWKYK